MYFNKPHCFCTSAKVTKISRTLAAGSERCSRVAMRHQKPRDITRGDAQP